MPRGQVEHVLNEQCTVIHAHCIGARTTDAHEQYMFIQQLLALDINRPRVPQLLPEVLGQISTPARVEVWQQELAGHPDQAFTKYVLQGLEQGFRVGFRYTSNLIPNKRNMLSAVQHPQVVRNYLKEELAQNGVVRFPKPAAEQLGVHCSSIGVIPKNPKPNKWRLIVDLPSPNSASINDGIDKAFSFGLRSAPLIYTASSGNLPHVCTL